MDGKRWRYIAGISLWLIAGGRLAGQSPPRAVPVVGEPFAGEVVSVDASWRMVFVCEDGRRQLEAAQLVRWGRFPESGAAAQVVLADGGVLMGRVLAADAETLSADSRYLGLVRPRLEFIAGVIVHPPVRLDERDRLLGRVLADTGQADTLIFPNGDELSGRIESIQDEAIQINADVGPLSVPLRRVEAVVFDPSLRMRPAWQGLRMIVGLGDGTRLVARKLAIQDDRLSVTLADGGVWHGPRQQLVGLQTLGGTATYLSDIEPAGFRHLPYLQLDWPYRRDRNVAGGLLRAGGRLYLKGLGVHSASRLTYRLGGRYEQFQAELAIDDSTRGGGSVRFVVYVDGQLRYASDVVRGRQTPVPIRVPVAGAERMDLVVDFADRADVLDRADWLDARLVPVRPSDH